MSRKLSALILLVFFLIACNCTHAQSFSYRHFTTEDGVSSSVVYCCIQDKKGYLWFGTDAGVNRFDGKKFEKFSTDDGLSDNEVFWLFEDSQKRIWFLTFNGHLSFFQNEKFHNEENTPFLKKMFVGESYISAFEDHQGNLYFGSFGSKFIVLKNDSVSIHNFPNAYAGFNFYEDKHGVMFVSSLLQRCEFRNKTLIPTPSTYVRTEVGHIQSQLTNEYFFAKEGLIRREYGSEKIIISSAFLLPALSITGFKENSDSSFLISTRGNGVLFFPHPYKDINNPVNFLPGKIVLSGFIDNENNTWFNTQGDGIYMLPATHKNIVSYTLNNGLQSETVFRITEDVSKNIWLACGNGIAAEIKNNLIVNHNLYSIPNRENRILDFVFDRQNILWAATDYGIARLQNGTQRAVVPLKVGNKTFNPPGKSIEMDKDGNIFVTQFHGVMKLHRTSGIQYDFFELLNGLNRDERTYASFFDRSGNLWVSNINGLNRWPNEKLICYGDSAPLLKSRILQLREINHTLLLVTDGNGIIFLKNGKITRQVTVKDGLPSNICRKVFIRDHAVWICTSSGLAFLNYENDSVSRIKTYNSTDGLVSNDVHDVFDDGERVYIATGKGLSILKKNHDRKSINPPPVYITTIINDGHVLKSESELKGLRYDKNTLTINFIAITFQNPEKVVYQYRLNESGGAWSETRNSSLEFSNLAPGNYKFSLRAKKNDSDWSSPIFLNFEIKPPFWKTNLFFVSLIAMAVFLSIIIQRIYSQRKMRAQALEISRMEMLHRERSRISGDMHDDLGSDLTKIVVLSEVIKQEEKLTISASSGLSKISHYADDLRVKMDEIIWALNPRYDSLADLIAYIHKYALDYFEDCGMSILVLLPDDVPEIAISASTRRNVFLIVKESFHNIYKHSTAKKVTLDLQLDDSMLIVSVSDDGMGFSEMNLSSPGNGLVNMRKRSDELKGRIEIRSNPGNGCTVRFYFSLKLS